MQALPAAQKKAYRPKEACARYGFGLTTCYKLIKEKRIEAVKIGAGTFILHDSIEKYFAELPRR